MDSLNGIDVLAAVALIAMLVYYRDAKLKTDQEAD